MAIRVGCPWPFALGARSHSSVAILSSSSARVQAKEKAFFKYEGNHSGKIQEGN